MCSSQTCEDFLNRLDEIDERLNNAEEKFRHSFNVVKDTVLIVCNNMYEKYFCLAKFESFDSKKYFFLKL